MTLADVPNELLSGSVAAWMNLNAAPLLVHGDAEVFTGTATDESSAVFGADNQRVLYTRVTRDECGDADVQPADFGDGGGAGAGGAGGRRFTRRRACCNTTACWS